MKAENITPEEIKEINPIGIILTGGPNSVYKEDSPHCDKRIFELGIPVLGICYGNQLLAWSVGGEVSPCAVSEYGKTEDEGKYLFASVRGLEKRADRFDEPYRSGHGSARRALSRWHPPVDCVNAAIENRERNLYGMQFHPEVESTPDGIRMIHNFLYRVCGADRGLQLAESGRKADPSRSVSRWATARCCLGLSGGVDSSVCAALLSQGHSRNSSRASLWTTV